MRVDQFIGTSVATLEYSCKVLFNGRANGTVLHLSEREVSASKDLPAEPDAFLRNASW